jgi:hypothetical protein
LEARLSQLIDVASVMLMEERYSEALDILREVVESPQTVQGAEWSRQTALALYRCDPTAVVLISDSQESYGDGHRSRPSDGEISL